jgi:phosphatidyl-myo-inositol alpha-mannosyltransferase
MKIGLVIDESLDYPDGVQQYVLTLGQWLSKKGHSVHYIVSATKRTDLKNLHIISKNIKVKFNANTLRIPMIASKKRVRELFAKEQFDLLHVQLPYSPYSAGRLIELAPKTTAIVGTFHVAPFSKREYYLSSPLAKFLKLTLDRFDEVVSVSVSAQDFAKRKFCLETKIIPNPVDLRIFDGKPVERRSKKFKVENRVNIVFLGRLVPRKGVKHLLKSIDKLTSTQPDYLDKIFVRIGGRGDQLNELRRFVKKKKLSKIVSFDGFIDEKDKPAYLASADIAVFPSLGGESFGISIVEAMASGKSAVLAGDNEGYRRVIKNKSALFDPRDIDEFATKLKTFIDSPNKRTSLARTQHERCQQYRIDDVGKDIIALYKKSIHADRHKQD